MARKTEKKLELKRTVSPSGDTIKKLRIAYGFSVSKFAKETGLDLKTIRNLEEGRPVYLETIKKCAKVFQLDCLSLIEGSNADAFDLLAKKEVMEITVRVTVDKKPSLGTATNKDVDRIIELLTVIAGISNNHVVGSAFAGSIVIVLYMRMKDAVKILTAYDRGDFTKDWNDFGNYGFSMESIEVSAKHIPRSLFLLDRQFKTLRDYLKSPEGLTMVKE